MDVYFLTCDSFPDDMFKIIITTMTKENIIELHKIVYKSEIVVITDVLQINDGYMLQNNLSRIHEVNSQKQNLWKGFFFNELKEKIKNYIYSINNLIETKPKDTHNSMNDDIFLKPAGFGNPGMLYNEYQLTDVCSIAENTSDYYQIENDTKCANVYKREFVCDVYYLEAVDDSMDYTKYIKSHKQTQEEFFEYETFLQIFQEFTIVVYHDFPGLQLADDMLNFCISTYGIYNFELHINKIKAFFNFECNNNDEKTENFTSTTTKKDSSFVTPKDLVPPHPIFTKNNKSFNIDFDKQCIIKEFADSKCMGYIGSTIKSSLLYEKFLEFIQKKENYKDFDISLTTFSLAFNNFFEKKRVKEGIIWCNIKFKDSISDDTIIPSFQDFFKPT